MTYHERLNWFLMWADHYGLILITPKYTYDDLSREWAK